MNESKEGFVCCPVLVRDEVKSDAALREWSVASLPRGAETHILMRSKASAFA